MTNTPTSPNDAVNHPSHYTQYPVEVIELTRHMSFCRGNTVKYVARAGFKGGPEKELEDLKKAKWYLEDEIAEVEKKLAVQTVEPPKPTWDPNSLINIIPNHTVRLAFNAESEPTNIFMPNATVTAEVTEPEAKG